MTVLTREEFFALPLGSQVEYTPEGDVFEKDGDNSWLVVHASKTALDDIETFRVFLPDDFDNSHVSDVDFYIALETGSIELVHEAEAVR